jgi:hypothetical protein
MPGAIKASFQTKLPGRADIGGHRARRGRHALLIATRRQTDERIERTLIAEARLTADLLARGTPALGLDRGSLDIAELDAEADRIGELLDARVTLIAPDGRVVGDSAETLAGVAAMETMPAGQEVVAPVRTASVCRADTRYAENRHALCRCAGGSTPRSRSCASRCRWPTSGVSGKPSSRRP